jgi:hypothetical protein
MNRKPETKKKKTSTAAPCQQHLPPCEDQFDKYARTKCIMMTIFAMAVWTAAFYLSTDDDVLPKPDQHWTRHRLALYYLLQRPIQRLAVGHLRMVHYVFSTFWHTLGYEYDAL